MDIVNVAVGLRCLQEHRRGYFVLYHLLYDCRQDLCGPVMTDGRRRLQTWAPIGRCNVAPAAFGHGERIEVTGERRDRAPIEEGAL